MYASLDDIRAGAFQSFNIVGYHVYGSGMTTISISPAPAKIQRFDARRVRVVQSPSFETSVTGVRNGTMLLTSLIETKIIRGVTGEFLDAAKKAQLKKTALDAGYVGLSIITNTNAWKAWHKRLKAQLELVLQDKPVFRDESKVRETLEYFKSNIGYIREKYGWDLEYMKQMLDTSFNEYLVKDTMES